MDYMGKKMFMVHIAVHAKDILFLANFELDITLLNKQFES